MLVTNKHLIAQARRLAEVPPTSPWGEQVIWTLREIAEALERELTKPEGAAPPPQHPHTEGK